MPEIKVRLLERNPFQFNDLVEPGDMWVKENGSIQVLFPRRDGQRSNLYFNTHTTRDQATGQPWTVSGIPPNITLNPSVNFDGNPQIGINFDADTYGAGFHGFLIDGVIRW